MGFIETSYGSKPNLSDVNIDSALNMGSYGILSSGSIDISGISSENAGEVDLNNCDLIGVKRFVCADYLGAVKATASDNLQATVILNDVTIKEYSKTFRVPSNFVNNSSVKISFYAKNTGGNARYIIIGQYINDSYTELETITIPGNTSSPTEFTSTALSNINAGELYAIRCGDPPCAFLGASGVKIKCDLNPIINGYWEVED